MKIVSLFTGAGGLDKGFEAAGFETIWANEFDKAIWETFEKNFPKTMLDKRSIREVPSDEIPDCDGIVGGPPCQSWSEAGALRGIKDKRGQLFFEFIRILRDKKPKFFLAENVSGMLAPRHKDALENIKSLFTESNYNLSFLLLNAVDYGVPQDRKRVFFIGIRNDLNFSFKFPKSLANKFTLQDCISDIQDSVLPAQEKQKTNGSKCLLPNHEYMIGGFSSMYMSRNRVRAWNEPSFTIQAGGRHAPLHPQAPKMTFIEHNKRIFVEGKESLYRRLSVRECARIQTFPEDFIFHYNNVAEGYKMVGNAVPCHLAYYLAKAIKTQLIKENLNNSLKKNIKPQAQPAFSLVPESTILIGYCQSKQRQWVEKKGLYNIRLRPLHK
ncbi:DNA cytosine methyltransferase [bacterium endosymbiont of Bathymodiolus sp. 5 South]|jgi:DNA (cytosine-5)-methyltransferase 1|uniref:DNA cytosine methyltransferase n=1 Tax=bacterium endosymbiont of Bathymodiolus sp. 5 South TaxID=1181670 RepID=UPI0010B23F8A|nr:DNA cytosine methyltransferase [bacterium endosymbiont of Bathymodiolus sp. 5 South]VVH59239.1 DNA-cytosine methyltransferase (EC [uncultured Gammaproteobacteria bacterium]SSC08292.1 DNA-cytosine methyltransferase [bacterium endosymbiont of Bathymodiolus sp. 5 South]VVH63848.1 DNA-cytosine methyltransferase (EC [uncultured Gammaproteobacteria bacterium]VVM26315.1 DNA-cytosine methyltransferase (EC [uncultured Gammaproteobacteria bacterium]VVM27883.1 DNA-cytosine methyltransferase (EC [uncul